MEVGPLMLACTLIGIAYLYNFSNLKISLAKSAESQVILGWNATIKEPVSRVKRVAIGLNINADLIVSATNLLAELDLKQGVARDHALLNSLTDLQESFAYFFEPGRAVERYFANGEVYRYILKAADRLESKEYSIGGNAALMAHKMAELTRDVEILLLGPAGPIVRSLLPSQITVHSHRDTDEVHLIMEYAKGERWGQLTTPIATRFITSNDVANSQLDGLDEFVQSVTDFQPDVVMFSGLNLLDGIPADSQNLKLSALTSELGRLPSSLPVHLELASMANEELVRLIAAKVVSNVHSLGLNEQELGLMTHANDGPHPDIAADANGYVEIAAVSDILYWILTSLAGGQGSRLSRVHYHSLTFHIIATLPGRWDNSLSAVGFGARVAGRQACGTVPIQTSEVELRIPKAFSLSVNHAPLRTNTVIFDPSQPLMTWRRGDVTFHFSPVLVCKKPGNTVGLGDAISATAMLYSRHVH